MPGIGSLLSVARTALQAQQAGVAVAGHNIANAQTAGYSRQTVNASARVAELRPEGAVGTGVQVTGILRARDRLLDAQFRQSAAGASGSAARRNLLQSVEGVLGAGGDAALGSVLDQFYNAWNDLSSNPASAASRANVRERGFTLTNTINNLANQVDTVANTASESASALVERVNSITTQIAQLNVQIVAGDAASGSANDLKDSRDRLIDELATIVPLTATEMPNGAGRVNVGGIALVDGASAQSMSLLVGSSFQVSVAGSPDPMRFTDGTLGHTMQVMNSDLPAVRQSLDALAAGIVRDVNALHVGGWSPSAGASGNWNPALGPTGSGINFFDPGATGLTARGMSLSTQLLASPDAIAAGNALNAPGNNGIALGVADLRRAAPTASGGDYATDIRRLVHLVAVKVSDADADATVNETLRAQASERRNAATAVSTDEELTNLMKYQQAYIAASKLVSVADELAQVVLGLIR